MASGLVPPTVSTGLVPVVHKRDRSEPFEFLGGRDKPGHDGSISTLNAVAASAALICAALILAVPAHAQDRPPAQRQVLIDLAYVLGESHALRQACEGASDQFWRERMGRLVQTEAPDADLDHRLKDAFNTGFIAGQSTFPACGRASRREQARLAQRGRVLAASLTGAMAMDDPTR